MFPNHSGYKAEEFDTESDETNLMATGRADQEEAAGDNPAPEPKEGEEGEDPHKVLMRAIVRRVTSCRQ